MESTGNLKVSERGQMSLPAATRHRLVRPDLNTTIDSLNLKYPHLVTDFQL